ncbi:unnamed protein product [Protopolystoma xenopodis]|uniref:Uncharacterized protein n=1 Tax=Protopolystoma xenopodis TaxID=117903 RepID=A0A448WXV6_9PLAT|nr:unnamed protein product [Protopolystoma xenopodis]
MMSVIDGRKLSTFSPESTVGQEESAVVFWWNRPSSLFTQHFHSKWKQAQQFEYSRKDDGTNGVILQREFVVDFFENQFSNAPLVMPSLWLLLGRQTHLVAQGSLRPSVPEKGLRRVDLLLLSTKIKPLHAITRSVDVQPERRKEPNHKWAAVAGVNAKVRWGLWRSERLQSVSLQRSRHYVN